MKILAMNMKKVRYKVGSKDYVAFMDKAREDAIAWLVDYGFCGSEDFFDKREFFQALKETSLSDFNLLKETDGSFASDRRIIEFAIDVASDNDFKDALRRYLVIFDYEQFDACRKSVLTPTAVISGGIQDKSALPLSNIFWQNIYNPVTKLDINPILYKQIGVSNITRFGSELEQYYVDLILDRRIPLDGENGKELNSFIENYYKSYEETRTTRGICESYYTHFVRGILSSVQDEVDVYKSKGYTPLYLDTQTIYFTGGSSDEEK